MKAAEYLAQFDSMQDVTFLIAEAHCVQGYEYDTYKTTPIQQAGEWLQGDFGSRYVVIKEDQAPIDTSGHWTPWYKSGRLKCAIIREVDACE